MHFIKLLLSSFLVFVWSSLAYTSNAQTASISANPNPCVLGSSTSTCTSAISFSTSNAPDAGLFFGTTLVVGTSSGTYTPNWININGYTFDVRANRNDPNSTRLASVFVRGVLPTGTISANPNPCSLASSSSTCTSTISFSTSNAPNAGLFFGTTLVVGTASGTYTPNWININGYTFDVRINRNDPNSTKLASIFVRGVVPTSPSASCTSVSPQASSTTATTGSFRIYAYGVANATSVTFPTWGNPGGQDDLIWYNGVNAGGGTWYADVNLANHKANAPEYGAFYSDVYLNNASQSNVYCGRASWSRSQPQLAAYAAEFVSQTVPTSMVAGNTYSVAVTMNNTGANTWTTADGYKLGSVNPYDNFTWGLQRVDVPSNIASGAQATFSFNVTAPTTPGTYNFQWRMLREGVQWFGNATTNIPVQVTAPPSNGSNLISNGGFELPSTSSYVYPAAGALPSWTISGGVAVQRNGSAWGAPNAPEGFQTAVLQGAASLSQTLILSAGNYTLKFKAAPRTNWGGQQTINVLHNGITLQTITPTSAAFTQYTVNFNAASGTNTIAFVGINSDETTDGDNSAFVDEVQLIAAEPIPVGAVRWDFGWGRFGSQGMGHAWDYQFNLIDYYNRTNSNWSSRWPFFTRQNENYPISLTQQVVDSEIQYASAAGLAYWAFVFYGYPTDPLGPDAGLSFYKTSTLASKPKYALILEWRRNDYLNPQERSTIVAELQSTSYLRIDGRPVIFLFNGEPGTDWDTSFAQQRLDELSSQFASSNGGLRPYIIYQSYRTTRPYVITHDACGTYAAIEGRSYSSPSAAAAAPAETYDKLVASANSYRDRWASTNCATVPPVTAGWDPSPRWVGFGSGYGPWGPNNNPGSRYRMPTSKELNNHVFDSLQWVQNNPANAARTVLIYAWNEFDEGGWIAPGYNNGAAPDTSRLDAVKRAIQGTRD